MHPKCRHFFGCIFFYYQPVSLPKVRGYGGFHPSPTDFIDVFKAPSGRGLREAVGENA